MDLDVEICFGVMEDGLGLEEYRCMICAMVETWLIVSIH